MAKIVVPLLTTASLFGLISGALAQNAQNAGTETVVVTGSLIANNGNEAPTPVTVVPTDLLLQTTPTNIPDAMNKLPIFDNSNSQQSLNNAASNNTGNFLNLRGFGAVRTLVLFDGDRVPATSVAGLVDVNTLPLQLIQRVDVVTGGASATYGSDAVTGVVNFILDKKFDGLKFEAQGGVSTYGDDPSWKAGLVYGTDLFGGKGHVELSFEHYNDAGIPNKFSRQEGANLWAGEGAGTAASPINAFENVRASATSFGGLILSGALKGMTFDSNGVLTPFVNGAPTGATGIQSGGDGTWRYDSALLAYLYTDQGFGRFDYDLGGGISAFAQIGISRATTGNNWEPNSFASATIASNDPFLSPQYQAAAGAGGATFTMGKWFDDHPAEATRSITNTTDATVGLQGTLLDDFAWNFHYTHGASTSKILNIGNLNLGRLAASLNAVTSGGQVVCAVSVTNPGLYPGCVPLNPFGPSADSQSAFSYIDGTTYTNFTNTMDDFEGDISGDLFSDWAGPVKGAFSAEYRNLGLRNISTDQPTTKLSCLGLPYNCVAGTTLVWQGNVDANELGHENVEEGAVEFQIPLLRDFVAAKSVDVNVGARYTAYSISGDDITWKVGFQWHVDDDLTVRGTRSQDIRAPSLNDLFAPTNSSFTGLADLHTNTTADVSLFSQGNPSLKAEVAQNITGGLVYQPNWLNNFSVSVDYYHIKVANAIGTITPQGATTQAQCEESGGTSQVCALYVRPFPFSNTTPANFPTAILSEELNATSDVTSGVDTEINYQFDPNTVIDGIDGHVTLRTLITYQPQWTDLLLAGTTPSDFAGSASYPIWRVNLMAQYQNGPWILNLLERWRSAERESANRLLVYTNPTIDSVAYTDVTVTHQWAIEDQTVSAYLSVQNLFNTQPPFCISCASAGSPGFSYPATRGDDVVGRYFTVGLKYAM